MAAERNVAVGGMLGANAAAAQAAPKQAAHKSLWFWTVVISVAVCVGIYFLPNSTKVFAGFSWRELGIIDAILFLSGLMSGLSGFGFSAVGASTLLLMQPVLEVPLLQTLSTANQLLSVEQLKEDMPKSVKGFWEGPGPCIVGGFFGVPMGIWVLSHVPAAKLMLIFGSLLVIYSVYSLFLKPKNWQMKSFSGPLSGAFVGLLGGLVGGFTAFPGAMVVVWTGLRDLPKAMNRAIVQPYIIMSQVWSLVLIKFLHPNYISHRFWLMLLVSIPAVLPGTMGGVLIYRRISDVNFKRVSFFLLGLSGLGLLIKILL